MPPIKIVDRKTIERFAEVPFHTKTALISITNYGCDFAELENQPQYLLQLAFDDIDGDLFINKSFNQLNKVEQEKAIKKYHMLSDHQAMQIVNFINEVWDKVDLIICQCEHGQSRSAGVAAAIIEHKFKNGIEIFADDRYYPNKYIFNKIYNLLKPSV